MAGQGRPSKLGVFEEQIIGIQVGHPKWNKREVYGELKKQYHDGLAAHFKKINPELKSQALCSLINAQIKDHFPKENTVSQFLKAHEPGLSQKNETDALWSLGSCEKYGIALDSVPVLLEYSRLGATSWNRLTIRRARWIARLYPFVADALKTQYADRRQQLGYLGRLADTYCRREQVSEVLHKPFPDTRDLDERHLIAGDVSPDSFIDSLYANVEKEVEAHK